MRYYRLMRLMNYVRRKYGDKTPGAVPQMYRHEATQFLEIIVKLLFTGNCKIYNINELLAFLEI